ncbi:hypothetical protein BH09PSE2_BH09PSE2_15410 [soil metagenome]
MVGPRTDRKVLKRWAPLALPLLCLLASVPLKLWTDAGGPLWLDEGWTLAIVQTRGAAFLRELGWDPNPPLYFVTLKAWTALAGVSNDALRTPSVMAAVAAPLFALLPGTGLPRRERWMWAALIALWIPGVFFAQEARGYSLLFALEVAAAALFLRVLSAPTLGRAAAWCGAASLCLLTHHHALILAAFQGVALLAVYRERAVRLWPAALLFAPAFGWLLIHAHRVAAFADPAFAWYPPMEPGDALSALDYGVGGRVLLIATVGLAAIGVAWRRWFPVGSEEPSEALLPRVLWVPVICAALGLTLVTGLGYLRPSFAFRYLTPYAPGLILAIPLLLQAAARERAAALGAVVMSLALMLAVIVGFTADNVARRTLQYEAASADLMASGVHRVAFLWDNPTNRVLTPPERLTLARTFFDRRRYPVRVEALVTTPTDDPAAVLYAHAPAENYGFIWLYDMRVPGTAAKLHPPRSSPLRTCLACATYAPDGGAMGVLACRRVVPTSPTPAPAPR